MSLCSLLLSLEMLSGQKPKGLRIVNHLANTLIRLPLLVAHTTLLETSCHGSYNFEKKVNFLPPSVVC